MKRKIERSRIKESALQFSREFKKTFATAMIAALGLIVALTWSDVITKFVDQISALTSLQNSFISALIITFIAVLGIFIISKFNK